MKIIVSLYMMNIIFLSFKDRIGRVLSSVIKPGPAGQAGPAGQPDPVPGRPGDWTGPGLLKY
jgi:hypothetical protein